VELLCLLQESGLRLCRFCLHPLFSSIRQTAIIAATVDARAKPIATVTSVRKLSMVSFSSLALASRSSGVKAASLIEFRLASSSSRAGLSSFTADVTAATSDSLAAVALREAKLDCRSIIVSFSVSRAEATTATSVLVAMITLRESKLDCTLPTALFNELKPEFRAAIFASMVSSLALSAYLSLRGCPRECLFVQALLRHLMIQRLLKLSMPQ
jgi:hypothetical protein